MSKKTKAAERAPTAPAEDAPRPEPAAAPEAPMSVEDAKPLGFLAVTGDRMAAYAIMPGFDGREERAELQRRLDKDGASKGYAVVLNANGDPALIPVD